MKFLYPSADEVNIRFIYDHHSPDDTPGEAEPVDKAEEDGDLTPQEQLEKALWAVARNPEGLAEVEALETIIKSEAASLVEKGVTVEAWESYKAENDINDASLDEKAILELSEEVTATAQEAEPLSEERIEEFKEINPTDFLENYSKEGGDLDEEGNPIPSRLDTVTEPQVSAGSVKEGTEVRFNFIYDGDFNEQLWRDTTAGKTLPKRVLEVESNGTVYKRRGFGEFFNENNERLKIHGGGEEGHTELKVTKIGTPEEISKIEEAAQAEAAKALEAAELDPESAEYARLKQATEMGALMGIDPDLTLALAQSEHFKQYEEDEEFLAHFEEALTEAHRIQDGVAESEIKSEDGETKLEYALGVLAPYISDVEVRKEVLLGLGYEEAAIKTAEDEYGRSTFNLDHFKGNKSAEDLLNSPGFKEKLEQVAAALGVSAGDFMQIFKVECGFDHTAVNGDTNATGLIQFMPDTAASLGTSTTALGNMTPTEQLTYVQKYYENLGMSGRMRGVEDLYLATFYPKAVGKPNSYVIGSHKGPGTVAQIASVNGGLDVNNDGAITVAEVKHVITTK